jgi:hypothetical protein
MKRRTGILETSRMDEYTTLGTTQWTTRRRGLGMEVTSWPQKFSSVEEMINNFLHFKQQMDQDETTIGKRRTCKASIALEPLHREGELL